VAIRVVDASAFVELLVSTELGRAVGSELRGHSLAAPAHVDAEVLSALGRLARAREVSASRVEGALGRLARAPVHRLYVQPLLLPSWRLRNAISLRDAIYVALAQRLAATLVTTDRALSRVSGLGVPMAVVHI
jgi:predicted nucleic acid-binding protein